MRTDDFPCIPFEKGNAFKGEFPAGLGDGTIHVIEKDGKQRLLRGFGFAFPMGERVRIISDQSRRYLGTFTVVGRLDTDSGEKVGQVPNRKLPMLHMK